MASAGGTWVKAAIGPIAGEYVFVPAVKPGKFQQTYYSGITSQATGFIQGNLAVGKNDDGIWTITHLETGQMIGAGFKNQYGALAAMQEMNQNYNWKKIHTASDAQKADVGPIVKQVYDKYGNAKVQDIKDKFLETKELQKLQKTGVAPVKPAAPAPAPKEAAPAPAPKEAAALWKNETTDDFVKPVTLAQGASLLKAQKLDVATYGSPSGEISIHKNALTGHTEGTSYMVTHIQKMPDGKLHEKLTYFATSDEAVKHANELALKGLNLSYTASGKVQTANEGFDEKAKTFSTGTKTADLGEGVAVIQKGNKGWNAGKILVKEDQPTGKPKWTEHSTIESAKAHAEQLVQEKLGMKPPTATPPTATAPTTATAPSGKVNYVSTIDAAGFDKNSSLIKVKTMAGKEIEKPGVDLGNGYMITKSSEGKYYVVDKNTNTTTSTGYANIEDAHSYAKSNTPYFAAPPDLPKGYTVFPDKYAASSAIHGSTGLGQYYNQHAKANGYGTQTVIKALKSYQNGGYDDINDHLWKGKAADATTKAHIKAMDKAFTKTATPYDMVVVRSKGAGSSLYKLAQKLDVGKQYTSDGFDSSSLHYNNNWGGGHVRLVYRVPKGTPALLVNGVHGNLGSYSSENELLFARGLKWNVIGKTVSGGNIELHLDYAGWDKP